MLHNFSRDVLATLYVTTASVGLSQQEIGQGFFSGDLFAIAAPVPGLATNRFAG